jgi:predicted ester cyclase
MGQQGTGKTFNMTVIDVMKLKNDHMIEHWRVPDRLALIQQLGIILPINKVASS